LGLFWLVHRTFLGVILVVVIDLQKS